MTNTFKPVDYDIIYLSYDEPNAEKNYADLCSKVPWAKRVHGVEGSDAAHKACANISETDRFITIDGDNTIDERFLNQEIDFSKHSDLDRCVISWAAENSINGLMYGNGGIKCWPKDYVLNMRTHENADPKNKHAQVDFCWDVKYIQMNSCYSTIHNNATAQQAWRAGFREGCKMALDRGIKPTGIQAFHDTHWKNLHRLYIWQMVGADVDNGLWAIYGARQGLYMTMLTDWDYIQVRDFKYLNNLWETEVSTISEADLMTKIEDMGRILINDLNIPISVQPLGKVESKFFKTVYKNPGRNSNGIVDREV